MTTPRYDLAPLAAALGIELLERDSPAAQDRSDDTPVGYRALAERLGVTRRTIQRWSSRGIPAALVDELACRYARRHPSTIWGSAWYDDDVEPDDGFPPLDDVVLEPCRSAAA